MAKKLASRRVDARLVIRNIRAKDDNFFRKSGFWAKISDALFSLRALSWFAALALRGRYCESAGPDRRSRTVAERRRSGRTVKFFRETCS
jgi:hypothetical protein